MTIDEILADYDDLEREDILAALQFAVRLSQVKSICSVSRPSDVHFFRARQCPLVST
jgi:hypothetical protein